MKAKNVIVHMSLVVLVMGTVLVGCGTKKDAGSAQSTQSTSTNSKTIKLKLSEAQVDDYPDSIA
jgi:hypothetical protein